MIPTYTTKVTPTTKDSWNKPFLPQVFASAVQAPKQRCKTVCLQLSPTEVLYCETQAIPKIKHFNVFTYYHQTHALPNLILEKNSSSMQEVFIHEQYM